MAQQVIDVGASANDGTGDTLRAAGQKANANFTELYDGKAPRFTANAVANGGLDGPGYWSQDHQGGEPPGIAGGVYTADPSGTSVLYQDFANAPYVPGPGLLTYTITSITTGSVQPNLNPSSDLGVERTEPGTYVEVITSTTDIYALQFSFNNTDAVIDNISFLPPAYVSPEALAAAVATIMAAIGSGAIGMSDVEGLTDALAAKADLGGATFSGAVFAPTLTLGTDLALADGGTGASSAAAARANLGLGSIATQSAASVAISGGTIAGIASLDVAGNVDSSSAYSIDGVKVVGNRATGWAVPTGTASRATFDTTTVTLPVLASKLKALIDDLRAHGLIGS